MRTIHPYFAGFLPILLLSSSCSDGAKPENRVQAKPQNQSLVMGADAENRYRSEVAHCKNALPNELACSVSLAEKASSEVKAEFEASLRLAKKFELEDAARCAPNDNLSAIPCPSQLTASLSESQTAWEAYRTAQCSTRSLEMAGGWGENELYALCETMLSADRIDELKATMSHYHEETTAGSGK